jgi:hypothetical protein
MKDINKIIKIWGLFDLCSFGWFIGWRVVHAQIPFVYDIQKSMETARSFGVPSIALLSIASVVLYLSLLPSGYYLLKQKRMGAIMAYIQTPFRLLTFIPPSIFFLLWPWKYIFMKPPTFFGIILPLISEALKLFTVIIWHKTIKTAYNTAFNPDAG